jgi:hypothetical protein
MIGRWKRKWIEHIARNNQVSFLKWQESNLPTSTNESDYAVISFSGSKWFPDQLYSLYTFYYNVGKPKYWLIYNDGSYTEMQLQILRKIDRVAICNLDLSSGYLPQAALQKFPTMTKVEIIAKHVSDGKMIIADSDILFYKRFFDNIKSDSEMNYYLVDEGNRYFDSDFLQNNPNIEYPFNFGMLILNCKFNVESIIDYIKDRYNSGILDYWSDQTAFQNLVIRNTNFQPLDKNLFKVGGSDSFNIAHCVDYNKIALRHFVGPVRHKMWQYSWKKVLGVS